MHRILIVGAVGLFFVGAGVTRVVDLERKLDRFDDFRAQEPRNRQALERDLEQLRLEMATITTLIDEIERNGSTEVAGLKEHLSTIEGTFQATAHALEQSVEETRVLASSDADAQEIERRLETVESEVRGVRSLSDVVNATASLAAEAQTKVERLDRERREREDHVVRWRSIVAPTVQLAGETTVGSGVLLRSKAASTGEGYETFLITAWHVVRDIRADSSLQDPPIPVAIYEEDGTIRNEVATLLHFDVQTDVALLSMRTEDELAFGATIPSREDVERIRIFHPIYAVGCPLGNDPIPTAGEVSDLTHSVDGGEYWMISAPTYIGNSGGGIYDADTHELLGIFSKIYTHGNLRPTVVPHMGLVTPLARIYDWLDRTGHGERVPD